MARASQEEPQGTEVREEDLPDAGKEQLGQSEPVLMPAHCHHFLGHSGPGQSNVSLECFSLGEPWDLFHRAALLSGAFWMIHSFKPGETMESIAHSPFLSLPG